MARRGKIPLDPLQMVWTGRRKAMQCTLIILIILFILFICALGAPAAAQMGSAEAPGEGLKGAAASSEHHSPAVNSSYNSSVIHLQLFTQSNNSDSPVRVIAGNGYYSSNPLALYSPLSRRTQVLNKGSSAASLHHLIQSAQGISGSSEYTVSERSYRGEDSTRTVSTSIGMQIDETVTEGKMRIGVFQADLSSEDETGQIAGGKASKPWKDPALEMEEEYIGTFQIKKNMTIKSKHIIKGEELGWLGQESVYLSFIPPEPRPIRADELFNCLKYN